MPANRKIAIPTVNGILCSHFGHCEKFTIVHVNTENKTIEQQEELTPPPHEPGVLPQWLHEQGVHTVIAGGMGMRAQQLFNQNNIDVIVGAPSDRAETIATAYLNESLTTGANLCDH